MLYSGVDTLNHGGRGILNMIKECLAAGLPEPRYYYDMSGFWVEFCNASKATATRDLIELVNKNILKKSGSSNATFYELI